MTLSISGQLNLITPNHATSEKRWSDCTTGWTIPTVLFITGRQILLLHTIAWQAYRILWLQWQKVYHLGATPIHPDIVHRYTVDLAASANLYQFQEKMISLVIFFIKHLSV